MKIITYIYENKEDYLKELEELRKEYKRNNRLLVILCSIYLLIIILEIISWIV